MLQICCKPTQQILATPVPDWQLPHWDTGFGTTTEPRWQLPVWGQSGNCQSGSEWHHTLALAILATAGNCHWGPEWMPHGYLWLLVTFLTFYTKMRWLDGSRVVPGVIPAPLLLSWFGDVQLVSFFSFCQFYQNYLFWSNWVFLGRSMWFLLFLLLYVNMLVGT